MIIIDTTTLFIMYIKNLNTLHAKNNNKEKFTHIQ